MSAQNQKKLTKAAMAKVAADPIPEEAKDAEALTLTEGDKKKTFAPQSPPPSEEEEEEDASGSDASESDASGSDAKGSGDETDEASGDDEDIEKPPTKAEIKAKAVKAAKEAADALAKIEEEEAEDKLQSDIEEYTDKRIQKAMKSVKKEKDEKKKRKIAMKLLEGAYEEIAKLKLTTPAPPAKGKAKKGDKPKRQWPSVQFSADDADCISASLCHNRRCSKIAGKWAFSQCKAKATMKHGYCQRCLDTTAAAAEKKGGATDCVGEGGRVPRDGDIRLWGGKPEEIVGYVDPVGDHHGFLTQTIGENDPDNTALHYIKKVPKRIRALYGLPDAPVVELGGDSDEEY